MGNEAGPRPGRDRLPHGEPLGDVDAVGLGKFNIGLVPASVTPPRTWKRAAWFAVLSSAGVLVGLAVAASELVSTGPEERIGLPGYPTEVPLVTGFPTTTSTPPTAARAIGTAGPAPGAHGGSAPAAGPEAPRAAVGAPPAEGGTPAPGGHAEPPTAVVLTTPSSAPAAVAHGRAIAARTERFYAEVATDTDTALALATEDFRADAGDLLRQRFAGVSRVRVTEIAVDPAGGVALSTLRVTRDDGTTSTERRRLAFTTAGEPLISAERAADGA